MNYFNQHSNSRPKGFTSVELLVAISLTFITIGFIYSAYLFTIRIARDWREKVNLENEVHFCSTQISKDILDAKGIHDLSKTGLILTYFNKDQVEYKYDLKSRQLLRNEKPLNQNPVLITYFNLKEKTAMVTEEEDSFFSFFSYFDLSKPRTKTEKIDMIYYKIEFQLKKRKMWIQSAVHPRNVDRMAFQAEDRTDN